MHTTEREIQKIIFVRPTEKMIEKKATLRFITRLVWRHCVQSEQGLEYKTEELVSLPRKETGLRFNEIKLEKKKSGYCTEGPKG